jgi:thioredoxin 1
MATAHVSDDTFDKEVLQASGPVVVDFWAEWCGPCKMIAPLLEELANELEGQVKIVKVNVDDNPKVAMKYGIRGIPTLLIFKNGQVAASQVGAQPKNRLKAWMTEVA